MTIPSILGAIMFIMGIHCLATTIKGCKEGNWNDSFHLLMLIFCWVMIVVGLITCFGFWE